MKKTLALALSLAAILSATPLSTADPVPKKNTFVMTVPNSYSYVYNRLKETLPVNDYSYVDRIDIEEAVVEEAVMAAPARLESGANSTTSAAPVMDAVAEEPAMEAPVEEAAPQTGGGSSDYSTTNVQVEGIDEGDIVKTDGKYIYVLRDSEQLILLSADGKETKKLSETSVANRTKEAYYGETTYKWEYAQEMFLTEDGVAVLMNCEWGKDSFTVVNLYDTSDPTAPKQVASLGQEGYFNTARQIGDTLYVLSSHTVSRSDLNNESLYDNYIPHLYKNGTKERIPLNTIVFPPEIEQRTYTIVTAYDLETKTISANKAVVTPTDTVYMSGEHLYLADQFDYKDTLAEYTESVYTVTETVSGQRTTIYKLSLSDPKKIVTKAVGTLDGRLLNQFSMDEYKGNLRVVTTHSTSSKKVYEDKAMGFRNTVWKDSEQTNGLYIFDETMEIAGSITGLAEDERVYSVRFTGDVGYFVTFRETDPLFAVDLSDAKNPKIMSELKIPGFSEYLHPYADGLLFGLGQDADAARTFGLKLSMFDTANPYDVFEKHKLSLDADYSEAQNNHKAIFISAKHGLIGFPANKGYLLYGYDVKSGFREVSRVDFGESWRSWRNARALYVGEMLYIVSEKATAVMDMKTYGMVALVQY